MNLRALVTSMRLSWSPRMPATEQSEQSFWLLSAVLFALLVMVNYAPVLLGKIPFPRDLVLQFPAWTGTPRTEPLQSHADIGDLVTQIYPFRALAARSIRAGKLPLWNPQFLAGAPFLANAQSALFYPPNMLYYVLPVPVAWTICIMLRMFLAMLFMAWFMRSVGASRAGSVFSGIVFGFCGFTTAWQGYPIGDAAVWLPFVCYTVHRVHRKPSRFSIGLAALAFAMPVFAGHPETAVHIGLAGTITAIFIWAFPLDRHVSRFSVRFLACFGLIGILALGLASIQMIPILEWVKQVANPFDRGQPLELLALVSRDIRRAPNSVGLWPPESAAYLGMATFLAAPLALLYRARRAALLLTILTAVGMGVALGVQPFNWMALQLPLLGSIKNSRMMLIGSFGMAGLAGLGISALEKEIPISMRKRVLAVGLIAVAFLAAFLLIYNLQLRTQFKPEWIRRPSLSRTLLFLSLILILSKLYGGLRGRVFPVSICGLAIFELATFSYGYTGFAWRTEIFPRSPVFDFLMHRDAPDSFRIIKVPDPYSANAQIMYGLSSADGYESRMVERLWLLMSELQDPFEMADYMKRASTPGSNDRRLDLLNVKYVLVSASAPEIKLFSDTRRFAPVFNNGRVAIFENKTVLPRVFAVPATGIEAFQNMTQSLERIRSASFDPERSVILDNFSSLASGKDLPAAPFQSDIKPTYSDGVDQAFHVNVSQRAVLVFSQTNYPGWKAVVDGQRVPVIPADIALIGIPVSAGMHDVRLNFEPSSFKAGAFLTIICLAIIGYLIFTSDGMLKSLLHRAG